MSEDWKDNKYGLEAGYSALNESEDFKYGWGGLLLLVLLIGCIGGAIWFLFGAFK